MTLGAQIALSGTIILFTAAFVGWFLGQLDDTPSDNVYATLGFFLVVGMITGVVGLFMMVWA